MEKAVLEAGGVDIAFAQSEEIVEYNGKPEYQFRAYSRSIM